MPITVTLLGQGEAIEQVHTVGEGQGVYIDLRELMSGRIEAIRIFNDNTAELPPSKPECERCRKLYEELRQEFDESLNEWDESDN